MKKNKFIAASALFVLWLPLSALAQSQAVETHAASFASKSTVATLDIAKLPQSIWHHFIMPGEKLQLIAPQGAAIYMDGQQVSGVWTAPATAGVTNLRVTDPSGGVLAQVTIFTLEPSSSINNRGYLGDYRIGFYPRSTPKGFIKLEKKDRDLRVSEHFKVGQFLCKQQPGIWPKYLLVSSDNLIRLEALLAELNETDNIQADTFFVMSGFRTPFYNSAIGSAKFSRHMYGDAADIYVDSKPKNGTMDDLNGDGKITKADADYLYDYAADFFKEKRHKKGGLGAYKANAVHGPFVHVDARGKPARWGR